MKLFTFYGPSKISAHNKNRHRKTVKGHNQNKTIKIHLLMESSPTWLRIIKMILITFVWNERVHLFVQYF